MKEPTTAKNITYYTIIIFPNPNERGYTLANCYKTLTGARKKALETKRKEAPNGFIVIRENNVILRDENNEFSNNRMIERI